MISEIVIPVEIRKEIFDDGLRLGKEYKFEGLGSDDWPSDPPPSIRRFAIEIFHKSMPQINVLSTEIYELEEFDEIENELEEIFNNGYHHAFEE